MLKMMHLLNTIERCQKISTEEKGISFTDEGFTDLYDMTKMGVGSACATGAFIGGATVGLAVLGVKGYQKIKQTKTLKCKEQEEILKEQSDGFNETSATETDVTDEEEQVEEESSIMDRINDILKKPSNLDDLKAVIKELKDNEKK